MSRVTRFLRQGALWLILLLAPWDTYAADVNGNSTLNTAPPPWNTTYARVYVFQVSALPSPPAPNKLYSGLPAWQFTKGPGYLMLLKYKSSPVGPYNELAYIPGKYKAGKCSTPLFSVQRIWVDSEASVHGGRSNWGLPKELAKFNWRRFANGTEVVSVRAAADQSLLLHGVFDPVTSGIPPETLAWVLKQELSTVPSMQWPLDKPATPTTKPLSFQLTYNPKALGFAGIPNANAARKILRLRVNFEAFTGNKTLNFAALPAGQPVGLALGGGTTGYFPTAETLACY
ncbi:hypothetical protein OEZ86_014457 [Tetradesmus obliquus]|nr:hypothetical protein OEZ86_014457 [Tetradesmus obliquus]